MAKLSVLIPVFNSAEIIEETLGRLSRTFSGIDHEILICDDGSIDASREVLNSLAAVFSQLRVLYNERNSGLGFTLQKLFNEASGDDLVYVDCDLPFGTEVILRLRSLLSQGDIVVASRYLGKPNQVGLLRRLVSRLYYYFCRIFFQISVRDIGSGSVALRRDCLSRLQLESRGFECHAELYVKAKLAGLKIIEEGFVSGKVRRGSFSVLKHGLPIILGTLNLWVRVRRCR